MSNRFKVTLPDHFNDILIENELKFKNGDFGIDTIRNILYLYSRAMEYYDSINNSQAYKYYLDKNNQMLTNDKVLDKLDKISFDVTENKIYEGNKIKNYAKDSDMEKRESTYNKVTSNDYNNININSNNTNFSIDRRESITRKTEILKLREEAEEIVKVAVLNLTERFDSYGRSWLSQLTQQNNALQNKLDNITLEDKDNAGNTNGLTNSNIKKIKTPSRLLANGRLSALDISIAEMLSNDESQESIIKKIIDDDINTKSKKEKEIIEAEEKLSKELENEIEEIKNTYKDDIMNFEEMGEEYKLVVEGLREDMEGEIENLKEQYQERKRMEKDKIERKYQMK